MDTVNRPGFRHTASAIAALAHIFGLTACILTLVWLLHYRGGLAYDSRSADLVFNCHPFFMLLGFVIVSGEAMMAYKTVRADKMTRKIVHMALHFVAICMGIVGINASFKFHDMIKLEHMFSLHSWIGIVTFCLYGLQWLLGLCTFLFPGAGSETKARLLPWHISGGRALLLMIICTALTGLSQKATSSTLTGNHESRLLKFTGFFVLLFGISIDIAIGFDRFRHVDPTT
ncbi:putative transmembrane ascorbate ferrireductase 3, partial [Cucurbita argyrosperma subsp. sororia]